jgi:hypothetical protein
MKVVKLNRRFRQFKEHGHTIALRFTDWRDAVSYEKTVRDRLGVGGWQRHDLWYSYFGNRRRRNDFRPYWITFRNEADLTLVLLSADLTKNG